MTLAARWRLSERWFGLNRMVALSLLLHLLVLSLSLTVRKGPPLQYQYHVTLLPKENRLARAPLPAAPNTPSLPKRDITPTNPPAAKNDAPAVLKKTAVMGKQIEKAALPASLPLAPKMKGNPLSSKIRPEPVPKDGVEEGPKEAGPKEVETEGHISTGQASFKFPYYLQSIENKISGKWIPPFAHQAGRKVSAVVRFTVKKNGAIELIEVETPSGNNFFDEAAMRAIYGANPLPPLPRGFSEDTLMVHFTFITHEG